MSGWEKWEKTQAYVWGQIFLNNQELGFFYFFYLPSCLSFVECCFGVHAFTLSRFMAPTGASQKQMQALSIHRCRGKPKPMLEGFDPPRFISRLHGSARHSCWACRSQGWRNIPAGGAVRALARVCTQCCADRGKPCESEWARSQGLLGAFTSLILSVVYSSTATSRAAGAPPPRAPPSHASGNHPSSWPSLIPVHPHPQAPTQCLETPPLSGTQPHPSLLGASSYPHNPFATSHDPSLHSASGD